MIQIVHGSVIDQRVDAIVNAANHTLLGGGGVDGAIHRAAGPALLAECQGLGGCETGDAKLTGSYDIERVTGARHIVHTVGPVWSASRADECERQLRSCYVRSCEVAAAAGDASIAFPAISCGVYGYALESALPVALDALAAWDARLERIVLAMFTSGEFALATEVASGLYPCQREDSRTVTVKV